MPGLHEMREGLGFQIGDGCCDDRSAVLDLKGWPNVYRRRKSSKGEVTGEGCGRIQF